MFKDWKSKIKDNPQLSPHLFWDVDKSKLNHDKMKTFIVQRVIERGDKEDFYAIFKLYGGPKGVREVVKKANFHDPRDEALARILFDLNKNDFECYKHKQLREKHLNC